MTERLFSEMTQLLPFSVPSENRKESFTKEMERASIFCFTELERAKGGGLILKQPPEKTLFLTEACYPFWLIPWGKLTLLIDGLNAIRHTLTYPVAPDVKTFQENMERSQKALENYADFLSSNLNYFRTPTSQKQALLNGLATNPNLLAEFTTYISEAQEIEEILRDMTVLPPRIDESAIASLKQELDGLKLEFQEDINNLYENMKSLNKITNNFVKTIRNDMKAVQEEFSKEIKKQEAIVTPKANRIRSEYDEQITVLTKNYEKQLSPISKEKAKLEKMKEQTQSRIEHCKVEAKSHAARKDEVGERKWKEAAKEAEKELSELQKKIKGQEAKLKEIEDTKSAETFRLSSESEARINEARKDLLELEASRDSKMQAHKQEIEKLKESSSTIITQISALAKLRESNLAELEKLGLQQTRKQPSLTYVPFYLACYRSQTKKRYVVFAPSIINAVGFSVKLKGALGGTKIKQILDSRFKAISGLLEGLPEFIGRDAVFERELDEASARADVLKVESMREQVENGLAQLKHEGWFSDKEYEAFTQTLKQAMV